MVPNAIVANKNASSVLPVKEDISRSKTHNSEQVVAVEKAVEVNKAERNINSQESQPPLDQEADQIIQEKIAGAIETIHGFIEENQRALDFDVAKESNRIIITVIDRNTNEVIRQIPPEEAIELAEKIKSGDDLSSCGVLFEKQV